MNAHGKTVFNEIKLMKLVRKIGIIKETCMKRRYIYEIAACIKRSQKGP